MRSRLFFRGRKEAHPGQFGQAGGRAGKGGVFTVLFSSFSSCFPTPSGGRRDPFLGQPAREGDGPSTPLIGGPPSPSFR